MNNELNKVAEPISIKNTLDEYLHSIRCISADCEGFAVMVNNLYQELENGNRCLSPEEAHQEALSALSYISRALNHIKADLNEATYTAEDDLLEINRIERAS